MGKGTPKSKFEGKVRYFLSNMRWRNGIVSGGVHAKMVFRNMQKTGLIGKSTYFRDILPTLCRAVQEADRRRDLMAKFQTGENS